MQFFDDNVIFYSTIAEKFVGAINRFNFDKSSFFFWWCRTLQLMLIAYVLTALNFLLKCPNFVQNHVVNTILCHILLLWYLVIHISSVYLIVCVWWQANGIHMHPVYLIFPVALAVNFSFILPVSTPGNAIVFAYGDITVVDMVRITVILPTEWIQI